MKLVRSMFLILFAALSLAPNASASEKLFAYTYEPETMPQGAFEFEQWTTLRTVRNNDVGQNHYTRWDLKQEFEYGVTDNYTLSLYLKEKSEYYRDPATHAKTDEFEFEGVSLENKWMILDPAKNAVGLSLYLEPSFGNGEIELEEKIILGQRFGADKEWKWAFNAVHATEWKDSEESGEDTETEGELEFDLGLTRELDKRWNLGVEFRNINKMPEYDRWEHTAFFVGPVISYRQENWWATLAFMTQVYGDNRKTPDPDDNGSLDLEEYELFNVRLIVGISF